MQRPCSELRARSSKDAIYALRIDLTPFSATVIRTTVMDIGLMMDCDYRAGQTQQEAFDAALNL